MTVDRARIVDGVTKYVRNEMLEKITDKPLKFILAAAASALEANPALADKALDNELVSGFLRRNGELYDVDDAFDVIAKTMTEQGGLQVVIPAIRLLLPEAKTLTFDADDVRKLRNYIKGGAADG